MEVQVSTEEEEPNPVQSMTELVNKWCMIIRLHCNTQQCTQASKEMCRVELWKWTFSTVHMHRRKTKIILKILRRHMHIVCVPMCREFSNVGGMFSGHAHWVCLRESMRSWKWNSSGISYERERGSIWLWDSHRASFLSIRVRWVKKDWQLSLILVQASSMTHDPGSYVRLTYIP